MRVCCRGFQECFVSHMGAVPAVVVRQFEPLFPSMPSVDRNSAGHKAGGRGLWDTMRKYHAGYDGAT